MIEVLGISFDSNIDVIYRYPEDALELSELIDQDISAARLEGPYLDITVKDIGLNFAILLTPEQCQTLIQDLTDGFASAVNSML